MSACKWSIVGAHLGPYSFGRVISSVCEGSGFDFVPEKGGYLLSLLRPVTPVARFAVLVGDGNYQ
jgi:hypothetical protein